MLEEYANQVRKLRNWLILRRAPQPHCAAIWSAVRFHGGGLALWSRPQRSSTRAVSCNSIGKKHSSGMRGVSPAPARQPRWSAGGRNPGTGRWGCHNRTAPDEAPSWIWTPSEQNVPARISSSAFCCLLRAWSGHLLPAIGNGSNSQDSISSDILVIVKYWRSNFRCLILKGKEKSPD